MGCGYCQSAIKELFSGHGDYGNSREDSHDAAYTETYSHKFVPARLRKYITEASENIGNYFKNLMGVVPSFKDVTFNVRHLPTKFMEVYKVYENGYIEKSSVPVGKIFGTYNPETNEIEIDPSLVDSKLKKYYEDFGFDVPSPERVVTEEMVHHVQNKTGSLARAIRKYGEKARDYIEGSASTIADRIAGETRIYPHEKEFYRKIEKAIGEGSAFLAA